MNSEGAVSKTIDCDETSKSSEGEYPTLDYEGAKDYLGLTHEEVADLFGIKASSLSSSTARHRYRKAFTSIVLLTIKIAKSK